MNVHIVKCINHFENIHEHNTLYPLFKIFQIAMIR